MKNNILKQVKDSIAAAMSGRTVEEMENEQRHAAVKAAVGRFLESNPDWKPSQQPTPKPSPAVAPVRDSKQKGVRIKKSLGAGAGAFAPHVVDEEALARARARCREIVAADPDRYSEIITNGKEA